MNLDDGVITVSCQLAVCVCSVADAQIKLRLYLAKKCLICNQNTLYSEILHMSIRSSR